MPITYKILGQTTPGTAVGDLYTVPASTSAIVSTVTASNVNGTACNISLFVVPSGGTAGITNAMVWQAQLGANTVQAFTLGITMGAASKLSVQSSAGSAVTYQAFGSEIS